VNGQLIQSNSAAARPARWTFDISVTAATSAVTVAIVVSSLLASAVARAPAPPAHATSAFSRLADIASHDGVYRASLVPSSDPAGRVGATEWAVQVETMTGAPVESATLALESWMPDDDAIHTRRPRVTRYLGDGRYRVEGIDFDRSGWWNVRLQITAAGGTDSLAFNLVR
jgi:hypothetical protein